MTAVIAISKTGFTCYGGNRQAFYDTSPEVVLSGPYDTGKTLAALQKLNIIMGMFPNARALMVRKTYKSLINSVVVTWEEKVHNGRIGLDINYPITKHGGSKPEWYDYPNGSRIVLGGLDNPQKILSAEYDFAYIPQAEELIEDEWEAVVSRTSGRAGNMPYTQVFGDANPGLPESYILNRERINFYETRHEDNPSIYERDNEGELTGNFMPGGAARMAALDAMTGVRYKRGRLGLWVGREGQVYEFDPAIHLINREDCPHFVRRYRVIDFGFTNPFVCQWWGEDNDGRLYMYREIYMSQRTVRVHAKQINELSRGETYALYAICDHDAEDRATLEENGIYTIAAKKSVTMGIEAVMERLKVAADGKPRLYICRDALVETDQRMVDSRRPFSTEREFGGYVWPATRTNRAADEKPVKSDDHGMDDMRYMVMAVDKYTPPGGASLQMSGDIYKSKRVRR
ncbi:MAG: terminase [Ketobacter sp.]|nr:terminase [Ketobacter sp.]